jgi:DHA1 family multidrug resistance protein-like MFS transporter
LKQWIHSFPRGVPLLFFNSILMALGFFALIPYLSYHLIHNLMWTPFEAGLLLMIRQISQQGLTFFTGMLADRIGYRPILTLGLSIRGIGFSLFAFTQHPVGLFTTAIITGVGGALFEPTSNAALTALTPPSERSRIYAIKKVMSNIGVALAALLGALLIHYDFMLLSLVCGGFFMFIGIFTFFRLPNLSVQIKAIPFIQMWKTIVSDHIFLTYTIISIGFWFMYLQMFLTIPLQIVEVTKHPQSVSLVYLLLSIIIIFTQFPITKIMSRYPLTFSLTMGLALMGTGLVLLGTTQYFTIFLFGFIIFTLGIMIVEPSNYELTSRLAKPEMTATYFGFSSLAMAFGGGMSQGLGGLLLQTGKGIGFPSLLWWISGVVALLSIFGIYQLKKRTSFGTSHI